VWEEIKNLSFKFFGRALEPYVKNFDSITPDLQKANINLSLTEYIYVMAFAILAVFLIEFPIVVIITTMLFKSAIIAFLFSITSTIFIILGVFFMFYTYPSSVAKSRKRNIDGTLPFATTYMATVASSGAPPITMFRVLGKFKEYGEISKEAETIYRDVSAFGMDIMSSIKKTASRTPSAQFKELLWGMETVLTTGSDLSDYLHGKSRLFMQEQKRRLQQFSNTLSILIEIYLTIILVGSIFFVIMTALMSIFGGGDTNLFLSFAQFIVILVVLPVVSLGFIFLIKRISPTV